MLDSYWNWIVCIVGIHGYNLIFSIYYFNMNRLFLFISLYLTQNYVTELVLALDGREGISIVTAHSYLPQSIVFLVFNINLYFFIPITIFYLSNKTTAKPCSINFKIPNCSQLLLLVLKMSLIDFILKPPIIKLMQSVIWWNLFLMPIIELFCFGILFTLNHTILFLKRIV